MRDTGTTDGAAGTPVAAGGWLGRLTGYLLDNKLVVAILVFLVAGWGLLVAPFDYAPFGLEARPVPVDAIPDIGENQQIVFTSWAGRSPQDVEDQVTYPLTVALLGVPGVRNVRSFSYFGFSSIYVLFDEEVEFYWSRSRLLEKLSSLPPGTLPDGVQATLGPDATALGQIFWYTVEGEGFDLHELRSVQDFTIRYALLSVPGVAEVASVGGYVREYQVDVDPDALRVYGISLAQVFDAVRESNLDVGARTIEVNRVEYVVRGIGFLRGPEDLEKTVIESRDNVPVYVGNVARVTLGPAMRRGALDKEGAEVVGGVVVARYGANPLEVVEAVRQKIAEIGPGLPARALPDGRQSRVTLVPFYDRTGLIYETLGTLEEALTHEILITVLVVLAMLMHVRSALLVSGLLPLAVLMTFIGMKHVGIDSNIMSLSGIAIAIGTMVDMGIIVTENILRRLREAGARVASREIVCRAVAEVGGAVLTAIATTILSFLPVFAMSGAAGKLFRPLAWTKSFALLASLLVALLVLPAVAHLLLRPRAWSPRTRIVLGVLSFVPGLWVGLHVSWLLAAVVVLSAWIPVVRPLLPSATERWGTRLVVVGLLIAVGVVLTRTWLPLGPGRGLLQNLVFVALLVGGLLVTFRLFELGFRPLLGWFLRHKLLFSVAPLLLVLVGSVAWLGFDRVFGFVPAGLGSLGLSRDAVETSRPWGALSGLFPGFGREFMPPLDEGSFLLMPTTMPHASLGEALDQLQRMDVAIRAIPEVESVVGKLGRADSPLDPAPISMFETVIAYRSEFARDPRTGRRILGDDGRPIRQWRDHIRSPDDIWREISRAARLPGVTAAPRLQPIAARLVMLQSGMRAPMGVKIKGQSLEELEAVGLEVERLLKTVPGVVPETVVADRIVGKPYLEIEIDRESIARFGMRVGDVQDVIEIAIGGKTITHTVEGRERYPVRVRYLRELRDSIESLERILVPAPGGSHIPITQLARVRYSRGPQVIKSEDTFLVGYVVFDKQSELSEVEAVTRARAALDGALASGELELPPGTSFTFAGTWENQQRSERTLRLVIPLALLLIFFLLYLQFRSAATAGIVFSGIVVAWSGGFLLLWLYGQGWFLDLSPAGVDLRELFRIRPVNLSVAVWVGFLALFGIASDNGVVMATYLRQMVRHGGGATVAEIRQATIAAAVRRVRPCLMTAATTVLALVPVLTSTGRGADVMGPMAIPSFGGMLVVLISLFVVPVSYCALAEWRLRWPGREETSQGRTE